jgi:hypothetical protein
MYPEYSSLPEHNFNSDVSPMKLALEIGLMSKEIVKKCSYCGSKNVVNANQEMKCLDCGMGKYDNGKP